MPMKTPFLPSPTPLPTADMVDWQPLLDEPFASALANEIDNGLDSTAGRVGTGALRGRVLARVDAALQAAAPMHTVRRARQPVLALAPGVSAQTLQQVQPGALLRPGEPARVMLISLAPGATFDSRVLAEKADAGQHRDQEWLLLSGAAVCEGQSLSRHDHHVVPAGAAAAQWMSATGACFMLRESVPVLAFATASATGSATGSAPQAFTHVDSAPQWLALAPGIQRRVLWQRGAQAALLYRAQAGAQIPDHQHGHAEECFVVEGELFLDDVLLQTGDYQLAPAGTGHHMTETDTGVVIYAHGDIDLQFVG
jgi:hypothetical protein